MILQGGFMKKKSNSYIQTTLNIIALGIAIYAVIISQKTLDNSNSQFEQNMQSSDSLFNYQLKYSKQLNDSLIYQISELQKITNNQLEITDKQLQVSIQTLQEEIYSRRPKIIINSNEIKDTNLIIDGEVFSPVIQTTFSNIGKRPAINFSLRAFVLYSDFSNLRMGDKHFENYVEPNIPKRFDFKPKFPVIYREKFYYCFEIKYYDEELKRQFYRAYYYHYYKSRNKYHFNDCDIDEVEKVRQKTNIILRNLNLDLFDN
jgi:hypothetical protein